LEARGAARDTVTQPGS
jgi:hypothetical protein